MSEQIKCYNFVTKQWEPLPDPDDGPTQEWVEGWNAYMHNGLSTNPYPENSCEAWEWQDGWDAARGD